MLYVLVEESRIVVVNWESWWGLVGGSPSYSCRNIERESCSVYLNRSMSHNERVWIVWQSVDVI
jgi:hypothetical protein